MNDALTYAGDFLATHGPHVLMTLASLGVLFILIWGSVFLGNWVERLVDTKDTAYQQKKRLALYGRILFRLVLAYLVLLTCLFLARIWLPDVFKAIDAPVKKMVAIVTRQAGVALVFLTGWEVLYYVIRKKIMGRSASAKQRVITLFPIVVNTMTIVFILMYGFVFLSEIGIDIAPLLTGAGVAGIAVGLAAQQSIKDLITGFTIIFEDLIQIGDVVKLGNHAGLVEKITLRKIQLRDYNGTVYTVPNGEIKIIENMTKDFSYALFDIGVAYDTDIDQAFAAIRNTYDQMAADQAIGPLMIEPVEIAGVDSFGDNAITIKVRIKTQPVQQWTVMRDFNRRLKVNFEKAGIEIPFPQRVLHIKGDEKTPALPGSDQDMLAAAD